MIAGHCARSDSSQFLLPFQSSVLQNTDHVACQYAHIFLYWILAQNCRENQNDCIILLATQAQCAELLKWPTYLHGYGLQGPGFEFGRWHDIFLFPKSSKRALGLTCHLFSGYWISFAEADLSPPSNAEVKNEWSCTAAPPMRLHGLDRKIFTFTCKLEIIYVIVKVSDQFVTVVAEFWKIPLDVSKW